MFTGIVAEVGTVEAVEPAAGGSRLRIAAPRTAVGLQIGDSVSINGVCLTAVAVSAEGFAVQAVPETLARTNLGAVGAGDGVDLERPVRVDGRLDGHIVQGHVDGVGTVAAITPEGESRRVRVTTPPELLRYVVEKGSMTVDGVSLTVTAVDEEAFEVVLIPHTLEVTVLGERRLGDAVNLEVDVLAKYVERLLEAAS